MALLGFQAEPLAAVEALQVDPGCEFMSSVSQLLSKHSVQVRRGRVDIHRDPTGRWLNASLEMRLPSGERFTEWVKRLPSIVAALNGEVTRLTG